MKNFQKITKEKYRELLNKTLFKTFFHSIEWHEFLEKEFKWIKFEYYKYGDEAILPLARFKVFGKEKLISLPFCEYGGPLFTRQSLGVGGPQDIDINEFKKDVLNEFKDIKIKFHPRIKEGELESDISTHWIGDLKSTSEQELLSSFRKTLRHEIEQAQEQNLQVKKCESLKELKQFYNLYVVNLKRKKTVPYTFEIVEYLYQHGGAELLLAFYKKKIVAGCLFLNYSGFVHYFLSASDLKYKNLGVNYLILWSKIKSLIGQDKIFDLGATPKGSSLDVFKRGWGVKEYPILQIGIKRSPAYAEASAGREENFLRSSKIIRNIWGLMPNFIIKILASKLIKFRL